MEKQDDKIKMRDGTTRGKKHYVDSAKFEDKTFNERLSGLIGLCSEMRNDFLPPSVVYTIVFV